MASADLLSGADGGYVADLYARFLHDRSAVDPSWNTFFSELGDDERSLLNELSGPSWAPKPTNGYAENGVIAAMSSEIGSITKIAPMGAGTPVK